MQTQTQQLPSRALYILKRIYSGAASVVSVVGYWRTGKTDFALKLSEVLRELGLIQEVASNIETKGGAVQHIQALNVLKIWGLSNHRTKLFIYDEVTESTPKRGAMTTLNVSWVRFIPQLSKMHMHVLAVTQAENLADSVFLMPVFSRGRWTKLSKTTAVFNSHNLRIDAYKLSNIPRTNIVFDPDLLATFTLEESTYNFQALPRTAQIAELLDKGATYEEIKHRYGFSSNAQVSREMRKICHIVVTLLHNPSEGKKVSEFCNKETKTI